MQDNWQDFDRQVRSMLQDAEAKAPRRVWRAVSERLNPAPAPVAWWKWAVPAFAMAALAVGLFFGWMGGAPVNPSESIVAQVVTDGTGPGTGIQDGTAAAEESGFADASGLSAGEEMAEPAPVKRSRTGSGKHSGTHSDKPLVAQVTESESTPDSAGTSESHDGSGIVSAEGNTADGYSEEDAARWARITQETPATRHTRLSGLYAQGGIGGNDSNITYGGTGISRMAPGAGSADAGISEAGSSTYGVPFTLGLGTRFSLSDKFSLGTGLEYSLLTRTFNGTYSDSYTGGIFHAVQYVGIPVNAYYDLMSTGDGLLNLYAWGGGSAEICVANNYRLLSAPGTLVRDKAGALQFSVALGIGVEIPISGKLSLYLDPAVRYYFHGNQPKSLRTDKPFMFNFDAGLRFNL